MEMPSFTKTVVLTNVQINAIFRAIATKKSYAVNMAKSFPLGSENNIFWSEIVEELQSTENAISSVKPIFIDQ